MTKSNKRIEFKSIALAAKKEPQPKAAAAQGGLLGVPGMKGKKGARPTSARVASARINTGRVVASRIDTGRVASAKKGTKKKKVKFDGFELPMVHIGSDSLFTASIGTGETNIYTSLTDGNFQVTRKPAMPIALGTDEGTYGNTLVNWKDKFIFSLGGKSHWTSIGTCAFFDLEHDEWHTLDNELRNNSANLSNHGVTRPGAMILGDKLYAYNGEANWDTCNGYNDVDEPSYCLKSI